jgi:hypothetical protein
MTISLFLLQLGRLPIELAALYDCRVEVEMLFPLTSPIPNVQNWSIDGLISHAKLNNAKPMVCYIKLECSWPLVPTKYCFCAVDRSSVVFF